MRQPGLFDPPPPPREEIVDHAVLRRVIYREVLRAENAQFRFWTEEEAAAVADKVTRLACYFDDEQAMVWIDSLQRDFDRLGHAVQVVPRPRKRVPVPA